MTNTIERLIPYIVIATIVIIVCFVASIVYNRITDDTALLRAMMLILMFGCFASLLVLCNCTKYPWVSIVVVFIALIVVGIIGSNPVEV